MPIYGEKNVHEAPSHLGAEMPDLAKIDNAKRASVKDHEIARMGVRVEDPVLEGWFEHKTCDAPG